MLLGGAKDEHFSYFHSSCQLGLSARQEAKLPSISAQRFYLITHTTTPSMIGKTKQQQYQLFINDFYFYFIRFKRGLTSFDFCSKMDNCGCVHLKPNRSGTAWRRTRCLRKTERLASNGSQNSWVIYCFYYYSELSIW